MSDSFDVENDVDVQEIMEKIRENVRQKKSLGMYSPDDERLVAMKDSASRTIASPDSDLAALQAMSVTGNTGYSITSHRRILGKPLVAGRQAVHGEVRRYVDPIVDAQNQFNAGVADYLGKLSVTELNRRIDDRLYTYLEAVSKDLYYKSWLSRTLDKCIEKERNTIAAPASGPSSGAGMNYLAFEDRFRGTSDQILQRQETNFLGYFSRGLPVLDIGCGRGEFLELLKAKGIDALGVDVDESMVAYCRSKGLDVELTDAVARLEKMDDSSLGGIFIDQVVEHLEPDYLVRMLFLCHRKLSPGAHIVVETVNPLSFVSLANFYIDMSHKKPIHPETLKFLLDYAGFMEIDTKFLSTFSGELRLGAVPIDPSLSDNERLAREVQNRNVEKLNDILFGAQDYAVIGKK
jgi:O-antigen chain-terminating methyltransferase